MLIIILIIACLTDPFYNNRYINPTVTEDFFQKPAILDKIQQPAIVNRDGFVPFIPGVDEITKLKIFSYYRNSLFPFAGIPYGIKYVFNGDFIATYPSYQKRVLKKIDNLSLAEKEKALKYIGCEYYLGGKALFNPEKAVKLIIEGFPVYLEKISEKKCWPLLVGQVIKSGSPDEAVEIFARAEFDPDKMAIVRQNVISNEEWKGLSLYSNWENYLETGKKEDIEIKSQVQIIKELSGFGQYIIQVDKPALTIFPGNYLKGWKAWIDGKRTEVFEVNLFSKGVLVPAGKHKVVLRYLPDSFLVGGAISILTLLSLIAFYLYFCIVSRKTFVRRV